jgi:hypothetical protein
MIAVALTLVRYMIDTRYNKFNYISTDMYSLHVNNSQDYSIFNMTEHRGMWRLKPSLPSRQCNARGHSPNSLVPHVPAYHLLRSFACTSRASALPALAVDKSLHVWASEASSQGVFNAKWPWP